MSSSLQTGGGACGHPIAPCARPGACTRASHRGGNRVRATGRSEQVEGGIEIGGGNEDGNGVGGGGGKGDVNGDGDGDGAGTGTGTRVEANKGAQHENDDGSVAGCKRERGRVQRPVDEHRLGTGPGAGTKTRAVTKMGTGTRMGTGTGTRAGSRRAEERRRRARNHTGVVDTV